MSFTPFGTMSDLRSYSDLIITTFEVEGGKSDLANHGSTVFPRRDGNSNPVRKYYNSLPLYFLLLCLFICTPGSGQTIDPIKFSISTNALQVGTNEEFEVTITAKYISVPTGSAFVFEGANSYRLNLILPEGFKQTGGDFYNSISGDLSRSNPTAIYKIKGKFIEDNLGGTFQLLRSHKNASDQSKFVQVAKLAFATIHPGDLADDKTKRLAVVTPVGYIPYLSINQLRSGSADTARAVYITDTGRFGLFRLDPADTSTPDDSAMVLVYSTKRFKRITDYVTPEMFGAKGDGVTNDHDAIQAAFNHSIRNVVFKSGATYKINTGLTLDVTSRIIEGKGATLDFSALTSGTAIAIRGLMSPSYTAAGKCSFANIVLKGNDMYGTVTALYLHETNSSSAISNCKFENVSISQFGTGIKIGSRTYINVFENIHLWSNGKGVHIIEGTVDTGANNRFVTCNISGNVLAIALDRDAGTVFSGCSIGENKKNVSMKYGIAMFENCHFEGADYETPPIEVIPSTDGTVSAFLTFNNCIFLINGGTVFPSAYFHLDSPPLNFVNDQMKTIIVNQCFFAGLNNVPVLCEGGASPVSRFIIEKSQGYWNVGLPHQTYLPNNLVGDGSFEDASLIVDNIFVSRDTAPITSKLTGSNINITSYGSDAFVGTKSIKVSKTGSAGTNAAMMIAIPCKPNTMYKGFIRYRQLGSTAGYIEIGSRSGRVVQSGNALIMKNEKILYYAQIPIVSNTWKTVNLNDFAFRTGGGDTHISVTVEMGGWGTGDLLLDDFQLYEY